MLKQGKTVPTPISGQALIDTGATNPCIDDTAAKNLGLLVVDVVKGSSATHNNVDQNVYPTQIEIVGSGMTRSVPRTIGANLASAGLLVLIGRDFLKDCVLIYNGLTGEITLASP